MQSPNVLSFKRELPRGEAQIFTVPITCEGAFPAKIEILASVLQNSRPLAC